MSSSVYCISVRGCDLSAYDQNGTAYVLLQNVKDSFYADLTYSSFLRRKKKIVSDEQPVPSLVVEQCRKKGILSANTHRASAITLLQLDLLFSQAPPKVPTERTATSELVTPPHTFVDPTNLNSPDEISQPSVDAYANKEAGLDMTAPNNDAQTSCMPDSDFLSTTSVYTADTEPADVEMATSMQTEAGLAAQLAPTGHWHCRKKNQDSTLPRRQSKAFFRYARTQKTLH